MPGVVHQDVEPVGPLLNEVHNALHVFGLTHVSGNHVRVVAGGTQLVRQPQRILAIGPVGIVPIVQPDVGAGLGKAFQNGVPRSPGNCQ